MLPPLIADMNIAVPVVEFLRDNRVDILSVREKGWGTLTDSEIMAKAYAMQRFVLTHDSDFGMLAIHLWRTLQRNYISSSRSSSSRSGHR